MSCSAVGAEEDNSCIAFNCSRSWPSSSCNELIVESFSESEALRDAISFSFDVAVDAWCEISRLYFSYRFSVVFKQHTSCD